MLHLRSAAESCPPEAAPGSMPASWELGARTAAVMVASSCCASPLVSGVPPLQQIDMNGIRSSTSDPCSSSCCKKFC